MREMGGTRRGLGFFSVAPEDPGTKVSHCLSAVVMHEGPEARIENDELVYCSPNLVSKEWQSTAMKHLVRAQEALAILLKDIPENRNEG